MSVRWSLVGRRFLQTIPLQLGVAAWLWMGMLTVFITWTSALDPDPHIIWLYDWHVYAAGGADLVAGDLYKVPLVMPGWPIPVDTYNLPPMSAVWTVPLLPFPDETAGIIWVGLGGIAWASSWWAILRYLQIPLAWVWTGVALAVYSQLFYWFGANILLGNINHLVLGLLVAFLLAHVRGKDRLAGVTLGLAMATKLWPSVLVVPLLRERRWTELGWSIGTAAISTGVLMLWLGPEAIMPMIEALRLPVPIEPGVAVLWTTAFRLAWEWWPAWGGFAVAGFLLVIPARGLAGIGLAMIAGISAIPNIWDHYLPTLIVAAVVVAAGARRPAWFRSAVPSPSPQVSSGG